MRTIKLNNGVEMPIVGTGTNTYGKKNNEYMGKLRGDTKEIDWALENGYRHFDGAQSYRNEEVIGVGIANSSVNREDTFITTKLATGSDGYQGKAWLKESIVNSLQLLQTDYIDLYLVHHPWADFDYEIAKVWKRLEKQYKKGRLKAIGVSNFEKHHLDKLLETAEVIPAVNQIESHPGKWNDELIEYSQSLGIAVTAWGPLKGAGESEVLAEIGAKYGKTPQQVALRYQIERDVIVIPKSHNKDRQAENLDIFDFELTDEERARIAEV